RIRRYNIYYDNNVYVGIGELEEQGSKRSRLRKHRRTKEGIWTHFSLYQVWNNIRDDELRELQGLFRHIYRRDAQASPLNVARSFRALRKLRDNKIAAWPREPKIGRR